MILSQTARVYWFLTRVVKANLLINNQGRRKRALHIYYINTCDKIVYGNIKNS